MAKKETKEHKFVKKPVYPGGNKALSDFITTQLKYPKKAVDNDIQGTVFAKYDIDYKGNVMKVYIKSGLGHGCDEEAIRLINLLKFEVPNIPYRRRIKFTKSIQIHFKFNKKEVVKTKAVAPVAPPVVLPNIKSQVKYTITQTVPKKANSGDSKSYNYSISIS